MMMFCFSNSGKYEAFKKEKTRIGHTNWKAPSSGFWLVFYHRPISMALIYGGKMKKSKLMFLLFFLTFIFSCQREKNPITVPFGGNSHPQVNIPWPSLANSPWPMFHHDPQSTGRSPYRGPQKGRIKWTFKSGGTIYSTVVIGADGTIYFPVTNWDHADSSGLYALSPNGKLKWWVPILLVSEVQPLVAADGTIFIVGGFHLHLYAINPDGGLKNEFNFSFELSTSINIGKDGTLYVAAENTEKGELYAVGQDGDIIWKMIPPHYFGVQSIPISPDGGTLYLFDKTQGNYISSLCAVGTDGQLKWRYFLKGKQKTYSSPLIDSDGNIYFGTIFLNSGNTGYGFYALSPQGKLKWKYPGITGLEPTMDRNGNIVFDEEGLGNLISLDFMGDLRWKKENREYSRSSLISDRDGSVYLASYYYWPSLCHITAYDDNGNVRWKIPFDGNVTRVTCPAIGRDGTLYVGTFAGKDSKLYAIE